MSGEEQHPSVLLAPVDRENLPDAALPRPAMLRSHEYYRHPYLCATLPPLVLHSSADALTQPCPLQEFWPLHAFSAVLHSLVPLQLLIPVQCTESAVAEAEEALTVPDKAKVATAAAINAPDLRVCFIQSPKLITLKESAWGVRRLHFGAVTQVISPRRTYVFQHRNACYVYFFFITTLMRFYVDVLCTGQNLLEPSFSG
jgi:hypothetical protein